MRSENERWNFKLEARASGRRYPSWSLGTRGSGFLKDAHHIFPQKFRPIFEEKGIIIDSPTNMAWWPILKGHRKLAKEYNDIWEDILSKNPSTQKILNEGDRVMDLMKKKYGF